MASSRSPLNSLKVASPCPANWDEMYGDDRSRFCGQCQLNVYNISGMTAAEAEQLLASREGRLCVRYYRRKDGTVLTKDCPVGLAALRRRMARVASAVAGLVIGAFAGTGATLALRDSDGAAGPFGGYERTMGTIALPPQPAVQGEAVMGDVYEGPRPAPIVGQPLASPARGGRHARAR